MKLEINLTCPNSFSKSFKCEIFLSFFKILKYAKPNYVPSIIQWKSLESNIISEPNSDYMLMEGIVDM